MRSLRQRVPKRDPSPVATDDDEYEDLESLDSPPMRRATKRPPRQRKLAKVSLEEAGADDASETGEEGDGMTIRSDVVPKPLVLGRAWLPIEDEKLLEALEKHGPQWKKIAQEMSVLGTKRTTAMCRNRHQRIRAPTRPGQAGRNRCKRCGQVKRGHTCTVAEDPTVTSSSPPTPLLLDAPMADAPAAAAAVDGTPATARPRTLALAMPGGPTRGTTTQGTAVLPEHSILSPATGNAFHVDVDQFLAEINRREALERAAGRSGHARFTDLGALDGGPGEDMSDGGGAENAPPQLTRGGSSGYLTSAAPPLVAGAPSKLAALQCSASGGGVSFGGASMISESADLVDLSDLQSAADLAIATDQAPLPLPSEMPEEMPNQMRNQMPEGSPTTAEAAAAPALLTEAGAPAVPTPTLTTQPSSPTAGNETPPTPGSETPPATACGFDALSFLAATPDASRAASPIPVGLDLPEPLMPLPSWSRAPSFSFASRAPSFSFAEKPTPLAICGAAVPNQAALTMAPPPPVA